jgi:hypothetical protein
MIPTDQPPNHALQRTRRGRRGCNRGVPCAGSLSLGRSLKTLLAMKLLVLASILILSISSIAGMRRDPVPHAITSPGGHFVFTMAPGPKGEEYSKGFGICYKIKNDGTFAELWRTNGWYSEDLELHYDGDVLARIGTWQSGDQENGEPKNSLAVAFYLKGKEIASYKISDLVKDNTKLKNTTAGLLWLEYKEYQSPTFSSGKKVFQLETVDGKLYKFDINTGAIVR